MSSSIRNTLQNRKIRTAVGNQNIDTRAPSKTDQIADVSFKHARETLIPQAKQRQANAIKTDQRLIYVYFKKTSGRICSCMDTHGTPDGNCPVCFKTGYVGGFDKFGTVSEILDTTSNCASANIVVDYSRRPTVFKLDDKAMSGTIVWDFELKQNLNLLDLLQVVDWQPQGSAIVYSVFDGMQWVPMTNENIEARLGQTTMRVKAQLSRLSLQHKSPELNHIRIRYNQRDETFVRSDWPHVKNSRALSEFGIYTAWQTLSFNIDDTISFISPDDWVFRIDRNERWKIISTDRYDPETLLLGHEVEVRLIQPSETYTSFPL